MESINPRDIIDKFLDKMDYRNNEHVLGCYFYGSYLTGYHNEKSDIDLHIVFDDSDPKHLYRGNEYIDGVRIEYFEKTLHDLYLTIDYDFHNQNNAMLAIVGKSQIIFDNTGELFDLQEYAYEVFSQPLPPLDSDEAKEYVSILNNRMEKLERAANYNLPEFTHLYHLTIEKIRKFYHRLCGISKVQTSKVYRIYTDENYRKSLNKIDIPEEEFVTMYIDAICDESSSKFDKLKKVQDLYNYAKRNVTLNENSYRILIKSRNDGTYRK